MIELRSNLWDYLSEEATFLYITTNGTVKRNGEAVMGRGCAAEAKQMFPQLPAVLGNLLKAEGNKIHRLYVRPYIYSFPVKHNWWEKADLGLIVDSTTTLMERALGQPNIKHILPRPGCGNGHLQWEDVRPLLMELPDNVIVVRR